MKTKILLLAVLSGIVVMSLSLVNRTTEKGTLDGKEIASKKTSNPAAIETPMTEKTKSIIEPEITAETSDAYILSQLEELSDTDLSRTQTQEKLAESKRSLLSLSEEEQKLANNRAAIVEPQKAASSGPLAIKEVDDTESEEELIKRLAKQTGMSEQELRDAFKGEAK